MCFSVSFRVVGFDLHSVLELLALDILKLLRLDDVIEAANVSMGF